MSNWPFDFEQPAGLALLDKDAEFPVGVSGMAIHSIDGDTKAIWDKNNPDEVAAARATFDALKKKKYLAYSVDKDGNKGKLITEFDPNAERVIMSPPMAGG